MGTFLNKWVLFERELALMSQQANIVLNDGETAPVTHTYEPRGARMLPNRQNVAIWRDQSLVNAEGFWTIQETHTPINANGMEKFLIVFDIPILETPGSGGTFEPPPTRAFGAIGKLEMWAHRRASEQNLKNLVYIVKNYTASALFENMVKKRDPSW
jgi:hypothetical protein